MIKDYDQALAQDILTKEEYKVKEFKDLIKRIEDFISTFVPRFTTDILQQYRLQSNKDKAIALSLSMLESDKTRSMTELVNKAITQEGTMNAKAMNDLINKKVHEGVEKAMRKIRQDKNAKNSNGGDRNSTTNAVAKAKSNPGTSSNSTKTTPKKGSQKKRRASTPSSSSKKSKKSTSPHSQTNPTTNPTTNSNQKKKRKVAFKDIVWKRSEQEGRK
jgi:hypothetical protein